MNKRGRKGFEPDRLKRLEELGFEWDPMRSKKFMESKRQRMFPRIDANWQKKYNALLQYKEKHGNIIIGPFRNECSKTTMMSAHIINH